MHTAIHTKPELQKPRWSAILTSKGFSAFAYAALSGAKVTITGITALTLIHSICSFRRFFLFVLSFALKHIYLSTYFFILYSLSVSAFYSLVTSLTFQFLPIIFFLSSLMLFQISFNLLAPELFFF